MLHKLPCQSDSKVVRPVAMLRMAAAASGILACIAALIGTGLCFVDYGRESIGPSVFLGSLGLFTVMIVLQISSFAVDAVDRRKVNRAMCESVLSAIEAGGGTVDLESIPHTLDLERESLRDVVRALLRSGLVQMISTDIRHELRVTAIAGWRRALKLGAASSHISRMQSSVNADPMFRVPYADHLQFNPRSVDRASRAGLLGMLVAIGCFLIGIVYDAGISPEQARGPLVYVGVILGSVSALVSVVTSSLKADALRRKGEADERSLIDLLRSMEGPISTNQVTAHTSWSTRELQGVVDRLNERHVTATKLDEHGTMWIRLIEKR